MTTAVVTRRGHAGARPHRSRHASHRTPSRPARPGRRRRNVALRRRIAGVLTVALLVLALGTTWAMTSQASDSEIVEATVVVGPGETVWDIARDYVPPGEHPQAYVADVLDYNGLQASAVLPGTTLRLPRR